MADRGIEQKIAALSAGLVLLEPSDPQGLVDLHTGFEEICPWADDASQPRVAAAAATKLIGDVVIEEAPGPEAAMALPVGHAESLTGMVSDFKEAVPSIYVKQ